MKIYTRTGDKGEASLIGGQRVPKFHPRLEAFGSLDELNALLGILRLHVSTQTDADRILLRIQSDLFTIGAVLANPSPKLAHIRPDGTQMAFPVKEMEADIDRLWAMSPELKFFEIPAGSPATAHAHHARTVCRRAERNTISLDIDSDIPEWVMEYLNRLSDWLFALARAENAIAGITATKYSSSAR